MKRLNAYFLVAVFLLSSVSFTLGESTALSNTADSARVYLESNGIRVVFSDVQLFFNATNGGEITEYYDLSVDPGCSRNLVNLGWKPWIHLLPLFSSLFYLPHVYPEKLLSTGGDSNALLRLVSNTSQYVILQSSSRIMSVSGEIFRDASGNPVYVNSTWIMQNNGLLSVERTFCSLNYTIIAPGWRWYPFYLTRRAGLGFNATFYMFNTSYAFSRVMNETAYVNYFSHYPVLPRDTSSVFGIAVPFCNTSLGGDGAHNILAAYKYDELVTVNEWRSDNYHSSTRAITESGPVYEFSVAKPVYTHVYHALVNFTHQPFDNQLLTDFASYFASNPNAASCLECRLTSNKDTYHPGDYFTFGVSGKSYYTMTGLTATFVIKNSSNRTLYQRSYGPGNPSGGQTFNLGLYSGIVQPYPDNYTMTFQIFSKFGIRIASCSKWFIVSVP